MEQIIIKNTNYNSLRKSLIEVSNEVRAMFPVAGIMQCDINVHSRSGSSDSNNCHVISYNDSRVYLP